MQHSGSPTRLLQLHPIRSTENVNRQAAACAELVGTCGAAAAKVIELDASSAFTPLASGSEEDRLQTGCNNLQGPINLNPGLLAQPAI